jgi:hypothetical protein
MVNKFEWNTHNTNKIQLLASNYGTFWSLVVYENFGTQNEPSTQLINVTSFVEMWNFTIGAEELADIFLAIKRCQRTKSKKVIKQSRSSLKKLVHMCAISG